MRKACPFEAIGDKQISEAPSNIALFAIKRAIRGRCNPTRRLNRQGEGFRDRLWAALRQEGKAYFALKKPVEARLADEAISPLKRCWMCGGEQEQQDSSDKVPPLTDG
jgi:hypothetical protein